MATPAAVKLQGQSGADEGQAMSKSNRGVVVRHSAWPFAEFRRKRQSRGPQAREI